MKIFTVFLYSFASLALAATPDEALKAAVLAGNVDEVASLLEAQQSNPEYDNNASIISAATQGHAEIVRLLLAEGRADPETVYSSLWNAATNGHAEVVQLLLNENHFDTPFSNLIYHVVAFPGVVEVLLRDGRVDPGQFENRALEAAVSGNHFETVKLLCADERVNPADRNNEFARSAFGKCNEEILLFLLSDKRLQPIGFKEMNYRWYHAPYSFQKLVEVILACKEGDVESLEAASCSLNFLIKYEKYFDVLLARNQDVPACFQYLRNIQLEHAARTANVHLSEGALTAASMFGLQSTCRLIAVFQRYLVLKKAFGDMLPSNILAIMAKEL